MSKIHNNYKRKSMILKYNKLKIIKMIQLGIFLFLRKCRKNKNNKIS